MSATIPVGGTTGLDHESSAAVDEAARWIATMPDAQLPRPIVPDLRRRFGITAAEACQAIREARAHRERGS
ncbi:MAG: hypothetical protein M9905_12170 [Rhizobiaceae bacterium]|nr:hypothetical protein [Rhizobiaceae bacterium]